MMSDEERRQFLNEHRGHRFRNKLDHTESTMVGFGNYPPDGFQVALAKDDGRMIITSPEGLKDSYELAG